MVNCRNEKRVNLIILPEYSWEIPLNLDRYWRSTLENVTCICNYKEMVTTLDLKVSYLVNKNIYQKSIKNFKSTAVKLDTFSIMSRTR